MIVNLAFASFSVDSEMQMRLWAKVGDFRSAGSVIDHGGSRDLRRGDASHLN